ncbi:thioesterase family protein [Altibacter sp.]|uniref:acyl-CoA thioesterase n=1 Tax=Altibacter sp. TaxID=2024823 RepID=UPI00258CFB17|nr:thioesterase family protein [Altibacter sp.]MCW9037937.1 acyl-CoA thioesterase [Altibacter sp.]
MKSEMFSHRFTVPAAAIDAMGHVNNVTYLQWCLDAAEAHWTSKTSEAMRNQYVWVVLNHFISYKAPSFEGEELEINTWVETNDGAKSERHYRIVRPKDKTTIVEAKTLWCLLEGKTHRPIKIPEQIITLFT